MNNPTVEKNYTTVFRDGSIIHENPWIMPMGKGKWYWNEEARGGVVAWFEIPEGGYKYPKKYLLPSFELRDLLIDANKLDAIDQAGLTSSMMYYEALERYLDSQGHYDNFEDLANDQIEGYYKGYEYKTY